MAIEIEEKFAVNAPLERVWDFVMDPHRVAACMPGAQLEEVVGEGKFVGSIRIKVGAITAAYKGEVEFTAVDAAAHSVELSAQGTETGGGTAKATMTSVLRALPDGHTELVATASVDLTGRIMQVGRGMIQGVSHQLFKQFVAKAKKDLEAEDGAALLEATAPGTAANVADDDAVRVFPLMLQTLWAAVVGFFHRLLGRAA